MPSEKGLHVLHVEGCEQSAKNQCHCPSEMIPPPPFSTPPTPSFLGAAPTKPQLSPLFPPRTIADSLEQIIHIHLGGSRVCKARSHEDLFDFVLDVEFVWDDLGGQLGPGRTVPPQSISLRSYTCGDSLDPALSARRKEASKCHTLDSVGG